MPVIASQKSRLKSVFHAALTLVAVSGIGTGTYVICSNGVKRAEAERQKEAQVEQIMNAARARAAERQALRAQEEEAARLVAEEARLAAEEALRGRLVEAFNRGQTKFVMPSDSPEEINFLSIVSATDPTTGEVHVSAHRILGLDGRGEATSVEPAPVMKVTILPPKPSN
ncbi:MAG: hypothetical protein AB7H77_10775 [Bdellovibrionales bacterium]